MVEKNKRKLEDNGELAAAENKKKKIVEKEDETKEEIAAKEEKSAEKEEEKVAEEEEGVEKEEEKVAEQEVDKNEAKKEKEFFEGWPIYLAGELCTYLDITDILALHEVSKATRETFRTAAAASVLASFFCRRICERHAIDKGGDAKTAWRALKRLLDDVVWCGDKQKVVAATENNKKNKKKKNKKEEELCGCLARNKNNVQRLKDFHSIRCTHKYSSLSSDERRQILKRALEAQKLQLRSDSRLCLGWINSRVTENSLQQVVAMMDNVRFLFSDSHITYSNNHSELHSLMRKIKFSRNVSWLAAASVAQDKLEIDEGSPNPYRSDGTLCWACGGPGNECCHKDDGHRGEVQCWNCSNYGHTRSDCPYGKMW